MATLTSSQRKTIKKQLDSIQSKINDIKKARASSSSSSPLPSVTATPTTSATKLNAAQMGGSSGVGFEDEATQAEISSQVEATTKSGGSKSQAGSSVSSSQAGSLLKSSGLDGLFDSKTLVGKSFGEAARIVQQEKARREGQVSANTSFSFNPETLKQTQRAIDKFGFALNDVTNNPFEPKEFKDEEKNNVIEVTSKELGSLFESSDQLYNAYQTNQQFRETLDKFIKKGGSLEGVSKNITAATTSPVQDIKEQIGGENIQTPDQYLANLRNPQADQRAEKMALEELAPESQIAQDEIARVSGIPKQLQNLYFGDEKTMGILQMKQQQALERAKLIEEQERDAKRIAKDKARLAIEKYKVQTEQAEAEIEENRLAAKNYMTAQLARLGALNTSGAAPLALQTLETKYQSQTNQIRSSFKFAERAIEIDLDEKLDDIENNTDELILGIQEDVTKDTETSLKEILKVRQDADKEIYRITEQQARRLRERTTKYTEDLKKEAEEYAKKFANTLSNGLDKFTAVGNPASKSTIVSRFEQQLEASRGADGYVNSEVYNRLADEWIAKGGTMTTFKSKFPTVNYANPQDFSLPPQLRYAKESQTLAKDDDDEDLTWEEIESQN